jgi:hypothetical protein
MAENFRETVIAGAAAFGIGYALGHTDSTGGSGTNPFWGLELVGVVVAGTYLKWMERSIFERPLSQAQKLNHG